MGHPFGDSELQVVGHVVMVVLEGFQLDTEVFQRKRSREVSVDIVIVQTDVDGHRKG